jgi:hypothetical protein
VRLEVLNSTAGVHRPILDSPDQLAIGCRALVVLLTAP